MCDPIFRPRLLKHFSYSLHSPPYKSNRELLCEMPKESESETSISTSKFKRRSRKF